MKRKGFTLIELLAVIVVLAIIALIATPIVINIIEKSRQKSAEVSMRQIERAAELYFYNQEVSGNFSETIFKCSDGVCKNEEEVLEISGKVPDSGIINVRTNGEVTMSAMLIDGFICIKEGESYSCTKSKATEVSAEKGETTLNDAYNISLKDYKIYGNSVQGNITIPTTNMKKGYYLDMECNEVKHSYWSITDYIEVDGTKFILKNIGGAAPAVCGYDENKNLVYAKKYGTSGGRDRTDINFESETTIKYIKLSYFNEWEYGSVKLTQIPTSTFPVEIESVGNLVTDESNPNYKKYEIQIKVSNGIEEKTTNIYLDEPLRKVGDYADYIDFKSGKVVRNVKVLDNTGALSLEESLVGLDTPVYTDVELPNINLFNGYNNITVDTNITPSNIIVNYYSKK